MTMRDFDRAVVERPSAGPAIVVPGPPRRVLVRLHDWHADQPFYDLTYLVLSEQDRGGWAVAEHRTRYRAISRAEFAQAASHARLADVAWTDDVIVGGQQVLIASVRVAPLP